MKRSTFNLLFAAAVAMAFLSTPALAQFVFQYPEVSGNSNTGFDDPAVVTSDITGLSTTLGEERRACLEAAALPWAAFLDIDQVIVVEATMSDKGGNQLGAPLGSAGANFIFRNFTGAPLADTWFPDAQANQLFGGNINADVDITADFNSAVDDSGPTDPLGSTTWYYGTNGLTPPGHIDFFSTAMHEIGHGLGFAAGVGQSGALISNTPTIYDRQLVQTGASPAALSAMNDTQRAAAVISQNLTWSGAEVVAAKGGNVAMYAPNPYEGGSSVSHWDIDTDPDEVMEPFATVSFTDLRLEKAAFKDMLWPIQAAAPGPSVTITGNGGVIEQGEDLMLVASDVPSGTYQWQKDGANLPGESATILIIAEVTFADAGNYRVRVDTPAKATIFSNVVAVNVVSSGALPLAGGAGLALLSGLCIVAGMLSSRRKRA